MRWHIVSLRSVLVLAAVLVVFASLLVLSVQTSPAQNAIFSNHSFRGAYVAQSTGIAAFPTDHLLSGMNGPYAVTGRLVAHGDGTFDGFSMQVNNGIVQSGPCWGTYEVENDGTFSVTVTNESKISVEYYGILFDEGKQAKLTVVGVHLPPGIPLPPLPPNFIGMTETGSLVRQ